MDEFWQNLQVSLLDYAGRLLVAGLWLLIAWVTIRGLVGPLRRYLVASKVDPTFFSFFINSTRGAILTVAILAALQQLGMQTASLAALVGAFGIAIALALQTSLANFASGLLLLSFRMVRIGDWIEVGEVRGQIVEMLPLHIVLITADHQRVTVPNTALTSGPLRNNSALPNRRVQWALPLSAADNLAAVKEAFKAHLLADARVLPDPAPLIFVQEWHAEHRTLAIHVWTATANALAVQQEQLESLGHLLESQRKQQAL